MVVSFAMEVLQVVKHLHSVSQSTTQLSVPYFEGGPSPLHLEPIVYKINFYAPNRCTSQTSEINYISRKSDVHDARMKQRKSVRLINRVGSESRLIFFSLEYYAFWDIFLQHFFKAVPLSISKALPYFIVIF